MKDRHRPFREACCRRCGESLGDKVGWKDKDSLRRGHKDARGKQWRRKAPCLEHRAKGPGQRLDEGEGGSDIRSDGEGRVEVVAFEVGAEEEEVIALLAGAGNTPDGEPVFAIEEEPLPNARPDRSTGSPQAVSRQADAEPLGRTEVDGYQGKQAMGKPELTPPSPARPHI